MRVVVKLPDKVKYIINRLTKNGYEAFAVGGCVRDVILGREPSDWDITTSATPGQIKSVFNRTIDTGIEHGTVTVMVDHEGFEVTTYRIDGEYRDGRHPDSVEFTPDIKEDLKRRDFTINAMAYNEEKGIVDEFGGVEDLKHGIIRCVGDARARFNEDALRILRAVRFAAQLGFDIEDSTAEAVKELASNLQQISRERICTELDKMLKSPNPDMMGKAYELGITKWIMPEFDTMMETEQKSIYHMYNVGEHTLHVLKNIEPDHYLRWAALLHDVGKPSKQTVGKDGNHHFYGHGEAGAEMTVKILRGLKMDNRTIKIVSSLVKYHDCRIGNSKVDVRRAIVMTGPELFPMLLKLKWADLAGKSKYSKDNTTPVLTDIQNIYEEIIRDKDCISMKDMAVNGKDIIALGVERGSDVGNVLGKLFDIVIENPDMNNKELLLEEAKRICIK